MIEGNRRRVVVEYGPGTGVVTQALLASKQLTQDSVVLLIEQDPSLTALLQDTIRDPRVHIVCDQAERAKRILTELGEERADYVLTSIPLSLIPPPQRTHLLKETSQLLTPNGTFIMWTVRGSLRRDIASVFAEVHAEREWRNIPPLWIFRATKNSPSRHAAD